MSGDIEQRRSEVEDLFGNVQYVEADGIDGEFGFVTNVMTEREYAQKAEQAEGILHMIRIEE